MDKPLNHDTTAIYLTYDIDEAGSIASQFVRSNYGTKEFSTLINLFIFVESDEPFFGNGIHMYFITRSSVFLR